MDNFELYGIPRSEAGYRTPGLAQYLAEVKAYVDNLAKLLDYERA